MKSDTPETNEAVQWYEGIGWAVPASLAVKLEQERDAVTEQRDKLAEALQNVINEDGTPMSIDRADEALQSLNQNVESIHPETKP